MWMPSRTRHAPGKASALPAHAVPLRVSTRLEACPPQPEPPRPWFDGLLDLWHACLDWLNPGPLPARVRARRKQRERELALLADARHDFIAALADLESPAVDALRTQVRVARSLHELWHLRAGLFGVVSRERSQHAARERLERLNRHFPTRSVSSGFAPLDVA